MESIRYFYSISGTDVNGPLTLDELRQLFDQQVITEQSFLCVEGETSWVPVSAADFAPMQLEHEPVQQAESFLEPEPVAEVAPESFVEPEPLPEEAAVIQPALLPEPTPVSKTVPLPELAPVIHPVALPEPMPVSRMVPLMEPAPAPQPQPDFKLEADEAPRRNPVVPPRRPTTYNYVPDPLPEDESVVEPQPEPEAVAPEPEVLPILKPEPSPKQKRQPQPMLESTVSPKKMFVPPSARETAPVEKPVPAPARETAPLTKPLPEVKPKPSRVPKRTPAPRAAEPSEFVPPPWLPKLSLAVTAVLALGTSSFMSFMIPNTISPSTGNVWADFAIRLLIIAVVPFGVARLLRPNYRPMAVMISAVALSLIMLVSAVGQSDAGMPPPDPTQSSTPAPIELPK